MKKCLFLSKEIVSIRIGWFGGRFWGKKILKWTKGGTTVCMSCGPPFGFDLKKLKIEILVFKMKKCLFLSKEIVRLELDGLEEDFEERKFWNGPKGGPQLVYMSCGPPFGFDKKFKNWNTCF